MRAALEKCRAALWVAAEHNELHFGKSHNTVIQSLAALAAADAALAAQPEPSQWQIWCDCCEGTGNVYQESQRGVIGSGGTFACPDCDGNGYRLKSLYAAPVAAPVAQPLTDEQITACVIESKCHGGAMRMAYESGPYSITQASINAIELTRAIERAHGIIPKEKP